MHHKIGHFAKYGKKFHDFDGQIIAVNNRPTEILKYFAAYLFIYCHFWIK